jgi:hypothetical protein
LLPFGLQDAAAQIRIGDHRLGRHAPFDVAAFKRSVDVQDASLIPGAVEQSGLTVAAQHYARTGEDALFSVDLKEARIIAVQLTVSNHSGVKVLLGNHIRAMSLESMTGVELFRRTERSATGVGTFLNVLSLGRGTTALRLDTAAANEAVAANFYRKSLREKVLQPGESVSGFVFFDSEALSKVNACLTVPFHSLDRLASLSIRVPVSGLEKAGCHEDGTAPSPPRQAPVAPSPAAVAAPDRESMKENRGDPSVSMAPPIATGPSRAAPPPAAPTVRTETLTLPNGDRYEGEVIGTVRTGRGRYFYANGDRYEGEFLNDAAHGKGVYFYASGDRYEGEFRQGQQNGRGIYRYAHGDRYEGEFQSGAQAGAGTYHYGNGDRYEGLFANGVRHGPGIYHFKSGDSQPQIFDMGTEVVK